LANIKSAIKRIRSSKRKQIRNLSIRTRARGSVKNAREAIASGNATDAAKAIQEAYSALDRAAIKGVIHKRNAARRKSRLMKQLAKVTSQK
jgi:small subunit ribosomal protein S20